MFDFTTSIFHLSIFGLQLSIFDFQPSAKPALRSFGWFLLPRGGLSVHWGYFRGTALPLLSIRLYVYMSIRLRVWEPEPRPGIARLIGKIDLELKCMLRIQT